MKKVLSLVLALLLVLSLTSAFAEDMVPCFVIGRLALNNCFEDEANEKVADVVIGGFKVQFKFYDSLDSMLLALYRGDVSAVSADRYVADYILASDENLSEFESEEILGLAPAMLSYSFGFMQDREDLKDKFDQALAKIIEDGTLSWLKYQLVDMENDLEAMDSVEMPHFEGAETIVIAVTGDLPPMDYVAADGTPRGFNIALLSELAKHMELNIEIMQVSSGARAIALQTGRVDALFWTVTASECVEFLENADLSEGMILSIPYMSVRNSFVATTEVVEQFMFLFGLQ